jgi:phosphohistidine phosphatase
VRRIRRLLLLRHAKAEVPVGQLPDADRSLSARGRDSCRLVADYLSAEGLEPDLILCSPSRRTRQTVELIAGALPATVPVLTEDRLYLAPAEDLLTRLRDIDDGVPSVMVVGHNPGMHRLAVGLLAGTDRTRIPTFPTAALAVEDLVVGRWAELGSGTARLVSFVTPRELGRVH